MSPLLNTSHSCAADRYGLDELKRLALRKQGLQSGIQISTILSSARWAYANTPDTDSKLRAHYLALIIRSRNTFKRSGTMQMEMEEGGKLFFDLFVAMCNHIVSLSLLLSNHSYPLQSRSSTALLLVNRHPIFSLSSSIIMTDPLCNMYTDLFRMTLPQ
jgi:hypothetical protein